MILVNDVSPPTEGVRISQPQVVAYIDENSVGEGTLTVSEGCVCWVTRDSRQGFALSYRSIIIHAISTDLSSFPHECIMVVVDATRSDVMREEAEMQGAQEEGEEDEDRQAANIIFRFVPSDTSCLQQIYEEMGQCQELNPEDDEDFSGEDEDEAEMDEGGLGEMPDGNWYTAANLEDAELSEEGRATLARILRNSNGANGNGDVNGEEDRTMEDE